MTTNYTFSTLPVIKCLPQTRWWRLGSQSAPDVATPPPGLAIFSVVSTRFNLLTHKFRWINFVFLEGNRKNPTLFAWNLAVQPQTQQVFVIFSFTSAHLKSDFMVAAWISQGSVIAFCHPEVSWRLLFTNILKCRISHNFWNLSLFSVITFNLSKTIHFFTSAL